MQEASTFLFMTKGAANKQYNAHLRQKDDGWVLDFEYGRRNKTLRTGSKTKTPLSYANAHAAYIKLVEEKKSDGYTEDKSGVAYAGTDRAGDVTGFDPQLLTDITQDEVEALAQTGHWWEQTKHDGERRGVLCANGEFTYSNRRGLRVGIAQPIQDALDKIVATGLANFELDCEDMGNSIVVFDILMIDDEDIRNLPFSKRAEKLHALNTLAQENKIADVIKVDEPELLTSVDKVRTSIAKARSANEEGLVYKDGNAPVTVGKAASGGPARKLKFWESATCKVAAGANTKRSISLELRDGERWMHVGNCTLPSNQEFPDEGSLVEIKYLYAYEGGKLFQPAYLGVRTDLTEEAATVAQLKYKREDVAA